MPTFLALAASGVNVDALRCAASCGQPVREGAVCCPMDSGGAGAWRKCPDGDTVLARAVAVSPAPLTRIVRLEPPVGSEPTPAAHTQRTAAAFDTPPDHVPLPLS